MSGLKTVTLLSFALDSAVRTGLGGTAHFRPARRLGWPAQVGLDFMSGFSVLAASLGVWFSSAWLLRVVRLVLRGGGTYMAAGVP